MIQNWQALNLANWEERVDAHLDERGYDLSSHRAGAGALDSIVDAEIGDIAGKRILHLQCHIGSDTIALAQRGAATVVGVDFSPRAIAAAETLARECGGTRVSFVVGDVYGAPEVLAPLARSFDLVFTTWGTISWLPDIYRWAEVVRFFLKPGGALYFADAHPTALVFDDAGSGEATDAMPTWLMPYFEREGRTFDDTSDYANPAAAFANSKTVQWLHPLADIVAALRRQDLRLDWLHEHAALPWQLYAALVEGPGGLWHWPDRPWLPLAVSLRADG